ncbi:MAG: hypothetical protein OXE57_04720 [Alphaproteobacteria bacterium]|nr:hypothetical protein [Alphaproteobacteria bacterium]
MPRHDLTEALQALVRRHGMSSVLHGLADLQATPDSAVPSSPAKRAGGARSKPSAIDYVSRMPFPPDKARVMERAAQRFEDKSFLPGVADIREFGRVYSVDLGKSVSRTSAIPRIFTFLAAMDADRVNRMLDEGAFSGPARLGPIADAIRNRSAGRLRSRYSDPGQPMSDKVVAERAKSR